MPSRRIAVTGILVAALVTAWLVAILRPCLPSPRLHRRPALGELPRSTRPRAPPTPPPGPPFPDPIDDQAVYDYAGVFQPETVRLAEQIVDAIEGQTKAEVVVYTQALGRDDITTEETEEHAAA